MKITNEFTVNTPIEHAWQVLTDLEGIAPCMPGARLTGVEGDVYQGKVKVKVGPVISEFTGTARFAEKDESGYRAVIDAKGRDARSAGNAAALVTAVLRPDGDRTQVSVDTDLKISGKLAQFGSGMIKEVSGKLLAQFVTNLEAKLATEQTPPAAAADAPAATDTSAPPDTGAPAPAASAPPDTDALAASGTAASASPDTDAASPAASATRGTDVSVPAAPPEAPATASEPVSAPATGPTGSTTEFAPDASAVAAASEASAPAHAVAGSPDDGVAGSPPAAEAGSPAAEPAAALNGSAQLPRTPSAQPAPIDADEPEPLDLLSLAGGSIYKRVLPVVLGVVVVGAVIVWLIVRR